MINFFRAKHLSVVHFYAPWAQQCEQINDVLEEMTKLDEYKEAKFAKVVAEDLPEISNKCEITAVPTVLLYKNDSIIDRIDGANAPAIAEKVQSHLSSSDSASIELPRPKEQLESKLKRLVNQSSCMLFMKGNPSNPRCGFSRTIISILDGFKTDYETFDILEDNEVREGLKKFSDWPTYPQLYLNGELLGGLDIVKEMSDSGELETMLPKKGGLNDR